MLSTLYNTGKLECDDSDNTQIKVRRCCDKENQMIPPGLNLAKNKYNSKPR